MLTTAQALDAGLVQYEVADPYAKAVEISREIADNTSAISNVFSRQFMWEMIGAKEGINAFMEKRPAKFEMTAQQLPDFLESECQKG